MGEHYGNAYWECPHCHLKMGGFATGRDAVEHYERHVRIFHPEYAEVYDWPKERAL